MQRLVHSTVGSSPSLAPTRKRPTAFTPIWNRLLSPAEITSIWTADATDLRNSAMYHSYA